MTVTSGIVSFLPDVGTGRTYTLSGDAEIQGTNLTLGAVQLPMHLDVGNDLRLATSTLPGETNGVTVSIC